MQLCSIFLISVTSGYTALMWSSRYGRLDVAHLLLESKADLEAKDNRYYPLRPPLYFGSIFLISVTSGWTALMRSSLNGNLDVTHLLIESKADLEAKDNEYYPLRPPLYFGSIFLISVTSGDTALMKSSYKGYLHVTRLLIESKADVAARNK